MKKLIITLFNALIFLPIFAIGQSSSNSIIIKSYDKLDNIKINKVVYYESPYTMIAHQPIEANYLPSWYWGYCANNYPLSFKNYVAEANSFLLPSKSLSETKLKEYEIKFKKLKLEDFPLPYVYCYGEIYFTDKKTKKQYLAVLAYEFEKESPNMEFNKIDILKFEIPKNNRYKNNKIKSDVFVQVYDAPTFFNYYVLDKDGVYKVGDNVEIHENIIKNGNSNIMIGENRLDHFVDMLKRSPNYIRSYIENGDRFFETVKQTPNGIVVIGKKRKQP
ncbi:hypothetical protein EOD40_16225 [Flavobacterium sufflavum]|uniref:Uncharacterized protein n=1 Tax=Flavobacterium sufflavum TaxID=1921138 RepID=A0A3S2V0V8_9FLAO|nr:hypothetical protein [Flavobacterium sufflavum]RVT71966.1 hypothetical protein EOD40_16225 [Flavobacterium sufflavum]